MYANSSSTYTRLIRILTIQSDPEFVSKDAGYNTEIIELKTILSIIKTDDYGNNILSLFNIPMPTNVTINASAAQYYTILANTITTIDDLINEYAEGNFQTVAQYLTMDVYNNLALALNNLQVVGVQYQDYETIRTTILNSLQGLMQAVNQYTILSNTEAELVKAQQLASILTDSVKLKAYLDQLKGSRSLFPDSNITVVKATLKPQYSEYIKRHGYPPSGIFDMNKLAICIKYVNSL
jgi:hypothetical protein